MDPTAAYQAFRARDPRFDGVFFIGVTSTGIYCRPICPAKTPKAANCRFFDSAQSAEKAAFRPCLRCRPELAPGNAPVDAARRLAYLILSRIENGMLDDGAGLETAAEHFGLSSRQVRRIIHGEFGVSPIALLQTRRLLLAKQLLTETSLPITDVAFSSGFSSLRRFNAVFRARYRLSPTELRNGAAGRDPQPTTHATSILQLAYRPPYDWRRMLAFFKTHGIFGVELIAEETYYRTVRLGACTGWIAVCNAPERHALLVEFTHSLLPVLPALLERLRNLFDLDARPDIIARHLMQDEVLREEVTANMGLRVPGAFDGFEMAVRTILGQQITVKAATTLSCRFAQAFADKMPTPFDDLDRLSPLPGRIAKLSVDEIARLGIIQARAKCIIALSQAVMTERLYLGPGADPERTVEQLLALPGIGPWTAQYIAMRALQLPDAFPKEDIAIRNNLGRVTPKRAEELSQVWRPWRSYAVLHIWNISAQKWQ